MKSISLRFFAGEASVCPCPSDLLSELLSKNRTDLAPSPVGTSGHGWGSLTYRMCEAMCPLSG